jgi:hypothetical protein
MKIISIQKLKKQVDVRVMKDYAPDPANVPLLAAAEVDRAAILRKWIRVNDKCPLTLGTGECTCQENHPALHLALCEATRKVNAITELDYLRKRQLHARYMEEAVAARNARIKYLAASPNRALRHQPGVRP